MEAGADFLHGTHALIVETLGVRFHAEVNQKQASQVLADHSRLESAVASRCEVTLGWLKTVFC